MNLNCIAVDDEPLALELIENYISKVPFLNLVAGCRSALDCIPHLNTGGIDLLFMDIEMPDISGIQFLKGIQNRPMVILTTAYNRFAIEGYELDVVDYLLKPISFERFLKAVNKAEQQNRLKTGQKESTPTPAPAAESNDYIFVRSDFKNVNIHIDDIKYIEGLKDYVKIYSNLPKPILTLQSLKYFEEKLPTEKFIRVHRSFIVSLPKISSFNKNVIQIGEEEIPIGELYKDKFLKIVGERFI